MKNGIYGAFKLIWQISNKNKIHQEQWIFIKANSKIYFKKLIK